MAVRIGPSQESQNLSLQVMNFEEIQPFRALFTWEKAGFNTTPNLYKINGLHVNNCRVFVSLTFHLNQMLLFTIYKMS